MYTLKNAGLRPLGKGVGLFSTQQFLECKINFPQKRKAHHIAIIRGYSESLFTLFTIQQAWLS